MKTWNFALKKGTSRRTVHHFQVGACFIFPRSTWEDSHLTNLCIVAIPPTQRRKPPLVFVNLWCVFIVPWGPSLYTQKRTKSWTSKQVSDGGWNFVSQHLLGYWKSCFLSFTVNDRWPVLLLLEDALTFAMFFWNWRVLHYICQHLPWSLFEFIWIVDFIHSLTWPEKPLRVISRDPGLMGKPGAPINGFIKEGW